MFNRSGDASHVDANDFEHAGGMNAANARIVASSVGVRGLEFLNMRNVGEH